MPAEPLFLGSPPSSSPRQFIGRITVWDHDPLRTWSAGALALPSGTAVHWTAYSDGVRQHRALFRPEVRVVVTAYELGGAGSDVYLTGIREATAAEWRDAVNTLASYRTHQAGPVSALSGGVDGG